MNPARRTMVFAALVVVAAAVAAAAAYAYTNDQWPPWSRWGPAWCCHGQWWASTGQPPAQPPGPMAPPAAPPAQPLGHRGGPHGWGHPPAPWAPSRHPGRHLGHGPRIVVSQEYVNRVKAILEADNETAALLNQGYNLTKVKPIVQLYVQGDGTVVAKAAKAVAVLTYREPGYGAGKAVVLVDVEQGKVLRIAYYGVTIPAQPTGQAGS